MTDEELLRSYDRTGVKCVSIVRSMYREGVTLPEIVDRLIRLGRQPLRSLATTFGTSRAELIPETMLRDYARRKRIAVPKLPAEPDQPKPGLVSAWCKGCMYFIRENGAPSCGYITIEKRRRGCPAGEGCTKKTLIRRNV